MIAEAVLRVLNANFLGGLNELRVFWSFSESALIAWQDEHESQQQTSMIHT
jgi:hypothetical protein